MRNSFFTLLILSLIYAPLFSQSVTCKWLANSDIGHSYSTDVKVDSDGNMFVTGYFEEMQVEDVYLYSGTNHFHIFLGKWDKNGNLIWLRDIGKGRDSRGLQIAINSEGEIILLGSYYNSINILDSVNYNATYGEHSY